MQIINSYLTKNDCYNSGRRITPIGIQVHSVGTAQSSASALASYWNQPGISACVHYAIDAETRGKVLRFLPENYRSWGDAGFGNNSLITFEMMESDYMRYNASGTAFTITDEAKFKMDIARAYQGAIGLCAKICKAREWNPKAKLSNGLYLISSHNEGRLAGVSSAHVDPSHVWERVGYSMDGFRSAVAKAMNGTDTPGEEKPTPAPYLVKVAAKVLNIRQEPRVTAPINGTITDQGVYTIVAEKAADGYTWGKLKSGYGWIALEYTKRK